jgi:hypothetical protein
MTDPKLIIKAKPNQSFSESFFLCENGKNTIDIEERMFLRADKEIRLHNLALADWLWNHRSISYSRYWEIAFSCLRKSVWSNVKGQDILDGTEIKTVRLYENRGSYKAIVKGLKNKTDSNIIVILYHPLHNRFDYYYIPKERLEWEVVDGGTTLAFSYPMSGAEPLGWQRQYKVELKDILVVI